jgi:hypothetical protein
MVADATMNRPQLFVWQRAMLCDRLRDPQFSAIDNNVYVKNGERKAMPLILWSPAQNEQCITAMDSPEELNKILPGFEKNGILLTLQNVFLSPELDNYRTLPGFAGHDAAAMPPSEIQSLLKMQKRSPAYVGAYPAK